MKHKKWYKLFVLIYNSQASRECEDQLCHWWMVDGGWWMVYPKPSLVN